jgi:hypothetical protein
MITRRNIYLPTAAMILTAALVVPAMAQKLVPFKGTFQGSDTTNESVTPPTLTTNATGIASHLGQFSFTQEVTLDLANFTDTRSAHLIAANGDSIDTTVVGSAVPGDIIFTVTEIHTITGGTVDSRVPRGALPCTAPTSWHSVPTERT